LAGCTEELNEGLLDLIGWIVHWITVIWHIVPVWFDAAVCDTTFNQMLVSCTQLWWLATSHIC
jgi:hypothetical protein